MLCCAGFWSGPTCSTGPPGVFDPSILTGGDSLVGYWALDGDGTDSGPNELHGTPVNAEFVDGLRGQAFFFTGDDTLHIVDDGDSPLDVDAVLMVAWIMPSHLDVSADRGIIMNKSVAAA